MNSHSNRGWGPLEYVLLIILIFLIAVYPVFLYFGRRSSFFLTPTSRKS